MNTTTYFITGNDDAEVRRTAQVLVQKLAPHADAFGLEIMETAGDTVDHSVKVIQETIQCLLTFPFLGGGKLVWLKGATFLKESPAGRSEAVQQEVEKLLSLLQHGLPEGITFLLSAFEADKRRSFYKGLSAIAKVTLCDKPDFGFNATEYDIIQWVIQRSRERGVSLEEEAAEILAARVGANSGQMEIELAKLITAAGEGERITPTMVRNLVPLTRAGGIFDLSHAISQRDLSLSLTTLQQLRRQGESAIGILLAAIVPTVRNLLIAKSLMIKHGLKTPERPQFFASTLQKLKPEEVSHLPRKKDGTLNAYGLGLSAVNARNFELKELTNGFLACRNTNQRLLRSQGAEDTLLTQLVIQLASNKIFRKVGDC